MGRCGARAAGKLTQLLAFVCALAIVAASSGCNQDDAQRGGGSLTGDSGGSGSGAPARDSGDGASPARDSGGGASPARDSGGSSGGTMSGVGGADGAAVSRDAGDANGGIPSSGGTSADAGSMNDAATDSAPLAQLDAGAEAADASGGFDASGTLPEDAGASPLDATITQPDGGSPDSSTASPCGNWALDEGEECDDGNAFAGDGCSSACVNEPRECLTPLVASIGGSMRRVANVGDMAYVLKGQVVETYAISNPTAPVKVGGVSLPVNPSNEGFTAFGTTVYVSDSASSTTWLIDAADPSSPQVYSTMSTVALDVFDHYLLAYTQDVLQVYDLLADALQPALVGEAAGWVAPWQPVRVSVSGTLAIVGSTFVDLSDPTNPVLLGALPSFGGGTTFAGHAVLEGTHAYQRGSTFLSSGTTSGFVRIFDVSDPMLPVLLGTVNHCVGSTCPLSSTPGIAIRSPWLYVGNQVLDISDPSAPVPTTASTSTLPPNFILAKDSRLFVAGGGGGVSIHAVSDTEPSTELGRILTIANALDLAVNGTAIYVADEGGVDIVDVSDPLQPGLVARFPFSTQPFSPNGVLVEGHIAYVSSPQRGLDVFDVTTPTAPMWVGGVQNFPLAGRLLRHGDILYGIKAAQGGAIIFLPAAGIAFSVADPAAPASLGAFPPTEAVSLAIDGALGIVGRSSGGAQLIDPAVRTATLGPIGDVSETVREVALRGTVGYLVAGGQVGRLDVYDLAQPSSPLRVGQYDLGVGIARLQRQGNTLLMSSRAPGVVVYDIEDAVAPESVDFLPLPSTPTSVVQTPTHYFISDVGGLRLLERPGPAVCGNSCREAGERCDDGNRLDGDECAADCGAAP